MCELQVILVIWVKHNNQEKNEKHYDLKVEININKWPVVDFKITLNSQLKS